MFIVGYIIIIVMRANHVVVPHWVGFWCGLLAIIEGSLYLLSLTIAITGSVLAVKNARSIRRLK